MPRRHDYDRTALSAWADAREGVLTHTELKQAGMPASTISARIGPRGPWQRLMPGVVLTHRGYPTARERLLGAQAYAGPDAVLTGTHALRQIGLRDVAANWPVRVLIPADRHRTSFGVVAVERTRRLPVPVVRAGLNLAPVPRAVVDAARHVDRLDAVRELLAASVQQGRCSVQELRTEVFAAARQRTALSRAALAEIASGVRAVSEARVREVVVRHGLPQPLWNPGLRSPDGILISTPDAYWPRYRTVLEIDSLEWHLSPRNYKRTQERQLFYARWGLLVIPVAPSFVIDRELEFVAATWDVLRQGALLPAASVVATRAA